ncbi:hypothetical protein [Rosenbergiella metrosideri]|uniref:hypothetical protein n=1 Tax=Rosenbergiella metrosideri TaxID=2921185 RepID=UPI001F4F35EC|nr:hypothetical protein [Rosenbergiella metrosideri]
MNSKPVVLESERLLKAFTHDDGYRVELVEVSKQGRVDHFEVVSSEAKGYPRGIFPEVEGGECKVTAEFTSIVEALAYFDCSSSVAALPLAPEGSN